MICGVASSSTVLIVGRAIAGIGVGGIFSGALVIISMTVPLAETTRLWCLRHGLGNCFDCRPTTWRTVHRQRLVEMVLLYEFSRWWDFHGCCSLVPPSTHR